MPNENGGRWLRIVIAGHPNIDVECKSEFARRGLLFYLLLTTALPYSDSSLLEMVSSSTLY